MPSKPTILMITALFIFMFSTCVWAEEKCESTGDKPTDGWTLHVDAKKHVPKMPNVVAHHYCKKLSDKFIECQLYDSDKPDAKLFGIEVIVDKETWNKFPAEEKKQWHYHKDEIPKVDAKFPDMSAEESQKMLKDIEETYGKVYILWDPAKGGPVGKPVVSILE